MSFAFEKFADQMDRNVARGSLEDNIPPEIEASAIKLLELESEAICGVQWVWRDQPEELRNRYRLWAFIAASRALRSASAEEATNERRA